MFEILVHGIKIFYSKEGNIYVSKFFSIVRVHGLILLLFKSYLV